MQAGKEKSSLDIRSMIRVYRTFLNIYLRQEESTSFASVAFRATSFSL